MKKINPSLPAHPNTYLNLLILMAALVSIYFVLRYQGRWVETDTALLTNAINNIASSHELIPQNGFVYTNGYSYQAIVVFLSSITGVEPLILQRWILPFAFMGIPLVFWILCHEVTRSIVASTFGTLFLVIQPELQFVVIRGSHEKFGRLLMILSLFLLFKTLKKNHHTRKTVMLVLGFYLIVFAFISSNLFLGFSFLAAIGFALICDLILAYVFPRKFAQITSGEKLASICVSILILTYFIAFYAYPPVQNTFIVAENWVERIRLLLLNPGNSYNTYSRHINAWVSPLTYVIFNLANWVVLFVSFAIWIKMGITHVRSQAVFEDQAAPKWILWLLYGAFGLQAVLSVASDASGMFGNLQHRIFPSLSILGVMVISVWIADQKLQTKFFAYATSTVVFLLIILSTLKSTNEPTIVGWWMFFTDNEHAALEWAGTNIQDTSLWVGYNERLYELNRQESLLKDQSTKLNFGNIEDSDTSFLISNAIMEQGEKFQQQIPYLEQELLIYNNNDVSIYKKQPISPYQK